MGDGVVSLRTIDLVDALRAEGVLLVVVTAARKSTLLERWPLLPATDAAVCETGARIYIGDAERHELDSAWSGRFASVTGPLDREAAVEDRPEPLWQWCRTLQEVPGLKVDVRSYYGCFRADTKGGGSVLEALQAAIDGPSMPSEVAWAMNLGKYDFFPAAAGKGNAVAYLQEKFGLQPAECVALFDDDNDLPMADQCGVHMLPGLTSDSVRSAVADHPEWEVASCAGQGVFAVEELLEKLLQKVRAAGTSSVPEAPRTPEKEEEEA